MHRGIMHRGIMHRGIYTLKNHASLNHASRNHASRNHALRKSYIEDFIPRWNLCITRRIHASLKIMHRGIMHSGIMHHGIMHRGNHASQNHASRVINYARREDFMPRQNLCIARRLHTSLEFIHREKNLCLAGIHASRKSCIAVSCIASH